MSPIFLLYNISNHQVNDRELKKENAIIISPNSVKQDKETTKGN